jgi:hypothetical protein
LETSTPVIGSYETNTEPGKKVLERIRDLAVKVGHKESAEAIEDRLRYHGDLTEGMSRLEARMVKIQSMANRRGTENALKSLWKTVSTARQTPTMKRIKEDLLTLADLNLLAGRRTFVGDEPSEVLVIDTKAGTATWIPKKKRRTKKE